MAAVREPINRVKIEHWRMSKVPIDKTVTVYQGDLMVWHDVLKVAQPSAGASGDDFIGMSETTNPVESLGSSRFLSDVQYDKINVIQRGLVEVIARFSATVYPFDKVYLDNTDAQSVTNSGSNSVGFIDPTFCGSAGKAVVTGDLIRIWLTVPSAYCSA